MQKIFKNEFTFITHTSSSSDPEHPLTSSEEGTPINKSGCLRRRIIIFPKHTTKNNRCSIKTLIKIFILFVEPFSSPSERLASIERAETVTF